MEWLRNIWEAILECIRKACDRLLDILEARCQEKDVIKVGSSEYTVTRIFPWKYRVTIRNGQTRILDIKHAWDITEIIKEAIIDRNKATVHKTITISGQKTKADKVKQTPIEERQADVKKPLKRITRLVNPVQKQKEDSKPEQPTYTPIAGAVIDNSF
ncbi:MAG: hypothetical protein Q4B16_03710 [Bacteroidia bacterium]|nr:hypothetical protein [Bacteroidia bacterium]